MNSFIGTPVYMIPCDREFVRWKRTHRKKRIAKKWQKKYGAITKCKSEGYRIGNAFYFCGCVINQLKKVTS